MQNITWAQDLSVTAAYSGNQAVSIGHSQLSTGSFESSTGNVAIAGVSLSGCVLRGRIKPDRRQHHFVVDHSHIRQRTNPRVGRRARHWFPYNQRAGSSPVPEQRNVQRSRVHVIVSAAVMHMQAIGQGGTFTVSSTTFPTNSGTSLRASRVCIG